MGILLLDTGFDRPPGDIGNATTWSFPVRYAVVRGVTGRMVAESGMHVALEPFLEAADALVGLGVSGIATSCGFLAALQLELAARCPVPVATSSLLQIPMIQYLLPASKTVGIVTSLANSLRPQLAALGVTADLPSAALRDDSTFLHDLTHNSAQIDLGAHQRDVLEASKRLLAHNPQVGAIVFECTNFSPHAHAVQSALGLPVFDVVSLVEWLHAGLQPRRFA